MLGLIPKTLRGKILFVCISLFVISLALVATINYQIVSSQMESSILDNSDKELRSNVRSIETWVKSSSLLLEAASSHVTANAEESLSALIQLASSGNFDMSYMAWSDGSFLSHNGWVPPHDYDARTRMWFKEAQSKGKSILTTPYVDAASGSLIVTVATPVIVDGTTKGVVAGDIMITSVINTVTAIKPTPHSFAFLSTNGETLIAHPDSKLTLKPITDLDSELTSESISRLSKNEAWENFEIQGRVVRLKTSNIPGTSWQLTLAIDDEEITAALNTVVVSSTASVFAITLIVSIFLSIWLTRSFVGLLQVRDALEEISTGNGDLTKRLVAHGEDEVAQIATAFNRFVAKLEGILLTIRDTSMSVGSAAVQITQSSQDLSGRTESTASSLQQASASLEELTSTVNQTAESSREAQRLSEESSELAVQGGSVVTELVTTMSEIEAASRQINEIVSLVDSIAFQTNLLALNASVEAARAGEHGRGFAVVASEVRNLAGRCADAAKQIKILVETSAGKTSSGSLLAKNAGESMDEIVSSVTRVVSVLSEISAATYEQSQGIGQINIAVAELDRVTQQNAAQSGQFVDTAASLNDQTKTLKQALDNFTMSK